MESDQRQPIYVSTNQSYGNRDKEEKMRVGCSDIINGLDDGHEYNERLLHIILFSSVVLSVTVYKKRSTHSTVCAESKPAPHFS